MDKVIYLEVWVDGRSNVDYVKEQLEDTLSQLNIEEKVFDYNWVNHHEI